MARQLPQINLKLLQTFLLVGEHLSFRVAAEKLFRSQSAISAQIVQLEEQLGVSLFHRTTRNVSLTAEGKQLKEYAERALFEVEVGLRKIKETADVRRGRVAFYLQQGAGLSLITRPLARLRRFLAKHPPAHARAGRGSK